MIQTKAIHKDYFLADDPYGRGTYIEQGSNTVVVKKFLPGTLVPIASAVLDEEGREKLFYHTELNPDGTLAKDRNGNTKVSVSYPDGESVNTYYLPMDPLGREAYKIRRGYRFENDWHATTTQKPPMGVVPVARIIDPAGDELGHFSYRESQQTVEGQTIYLYDVRWNQASTDPNINTSLMEIAFLATGERYFETYGQINEFRKGLSISERLYYRNNRPYLAVNYQGDMHKIFLPVEVPGKPGYVMMKEFQLSRDLKTGIFKIVDMKVDKFRYFIYHNERLIDSLTFLSGDQPYGQIRVYDLSRLLATLRAR